MYETLLAIPTLIDPATTLYGGLAATYGSLAATSTHGCAGRCYWISAALHGLLALSHALHW